MNFDLDADDLALQAAVRDVCARHFPMERVRSLARVDAAAWRALGDAGVFSLSVVGSGLGMAHAVLVFEELGRALVPGPLVATFLGARWLASAARGESACGMVSSRPPYLVEHAGSVQDVLVLSSEGVFRFEASSAGGVVREPLDPLTPLSELDALPERSQLAGPEDAARARLEGAALTAALALGIAAATTDAAAAYAKERVQFGRTIGSFQAMKHMLADMLVRAEVARAAVYAAGCTLDDVGVDDDARAAVATAKLLACEAALANGKASIQVHGGMGFTWEVDAHLFVKRAAVLATHFGDASEHALEMANTLS